MPNAPLMRKELEYITAHRGEWNRSIWVKESATSACGTVGCLAGNAALHAGRVVAYSDVETCKTHYLPDNYGTYGYVGGFKAWTVLGAELFEINRYQAMKLFDATNSLEDLWRIANEITDGEVEIPLEFQGVSE